MTTLRRAPRSYHSSGKPPPLISGDVKALSEDGRLGQFEILESRGIAERDQNGAASLCRMGAMSRVRLDVEFRTFRVRNALVYEVTIQDIRHLGCLFVQVPRNLAPRLHSQYGHCWTKGLITIQYFDRGRSFCVWKRRFYGLGLRGFDCLYTIH